MKSELKLYQKRVLENSFIIEMKLWEITISTHYPHGIKYSLIIIDPQTKKKVLMDNHKPKGYHYHINEKEFNYKYKDIEQLIDDFYSLVKEHLGISL